MACSQGCEQDGDRIHTVCPCQTVRGRKTRQWAMGTWHLGARRYICRARMKGPLKPRGLIERNTRKCLLNPSKIRKRRWAAGSILDHRWGTVSISAHLEGEGLGIWVVSNGIEKHFNNYYVCVYSMMKERRRMWVMGNVCILREW